MKVLFAVSNEEISESIVKKYQKEYKQIISYKNVYYFNAILKEIQKDKSYDRIVISEDLEAFTHTQYDQIDKFIFDKLDSISDEASNSKGNDIPIILICSDRRVKSEEILVKLFGIGIYNAIIGNDRSVDEVCRLIHRPRAKKEAKTYYKIDSEDVSYQSENENDVSEIEIQNIVAHYKRLGKSEERYIESFNNIAAQYNDTQLRIISRFLPLNVKAVLEEKSQKYQQVMSFNNSVSNNLRYQNKKNQEEGPSQTLLKPKNRETIMSKPVVIPSAVNAGASRKLSKHKAPEIEPEVQQKYYKEPKPQENTQNSELDEVQNILENIDVPQVQENDNTNNTKKRRGRPRKNSMPEVVQDSDTTVKRRRGRPRKADNLDIQTPEEDFNVEPILPGFDDQDKQEPILESIEKNPIEQIETILPGFDDEPEETTLPGFDELLNTNDNSDNQVTNNERFQYNQVQVNKEKSDVNIDKPKPQINYESTIDLSKLLTSDKKIVTFVGTSKNGTSFIVNNIAELMSSVGVNVAILDTTKNRNSYYIYTKNEEELRNIAAHSLEGLVQGVTQGIKVNKNLTVYTSLPDENEYIQNVDKILETLLKNHSLILIDTDFDTPIGYFKQSQETYLVQSLDVLTIQPLTAFLRDLKAKNVLDAKKLRIILNKTVKIRGITDKIIIGGMACYNDPSMTFMTELFDRNMIRYVSLPFEEETYIRYLEGIIECEISLKGYSKIFMQTLKELGNMIYPLVTPKKNQGYRPPSVGTSGENNNFSPNINDTLDKMKRGY